MPYKCASFDEICRRASGRRAYNKRRRLARAHRISAMIAAQVWRADITGRELAAHLGVHESTVSRDLKFIKRLRRDFGRMIGDLGGGLAENEMSPRSFKWLRNARGWEITFEIRNGMRVR